MAHTEQVTVKVPHLTQGRANTGARSLKVLFRGSHISPLIHTVKVSPQLATVLKAEGRSSIQGQPRYKNNLCPLKNERIKMMLQRVARVAKSWT